MDFRQCKIRYLSNENNWLSLQCYTLDLTNKLYKQTLKKLQCKQTNSHDQEDKQNICPRNTGLKQMVQHNKQYLEKLKQIKVLLLQRLKYHESHIKTLQHVETNNIEKFADQIWLYYESLQKYDSRLLWINQRIIEKQILLQNVQGKKSQRVITNLEQKIRNMQINQVIYGYEAYPKVKQLINNRKQLLLQKLGTFQRKNEKTQRQLTSITNVLNQEQNINKKVKFSCKTPRNIANPISTVFQSTMLCYKKRRYHNLQLKKQIMQLKKRKQQIEETCRILVTGLQLRSNQEAEEKISDKESVKKMQQQDFSINISKIGGRTYLQNNIQNYDQKQIHNQCILGNLNGLGYNIKGFTQELWEDIPSLLID